VTHKIVKISILYMYETCERHNYYVRATTDEGMTRDVEGHRSGSLYTIVDGVQTGISREEARDRALIDAATWGDFLGIIPTPYVEDGVTHEPSMTFDTYSHQREMDERRQAKAK
jgi:hypothetical protein